MYSLTNWESINQGILITVNENDCYMQIPLKDGRKISYRLGDRADFVREYRNPETMTAVESRFLEKYHDIVYQFLKSEKLSIEDYYDVVIFGYLKAVRDYHRKESAQRYSFRAVAYRSMKDCVYKHWRAEGTQKRKPEHGIVSLDYDLNDGEGKETPLHDLIADRRNGIDDFETVCMMGNVVDALEDGGYKEAKKILKMLLEGYKETEIRRELQISKAEYRAQMSVIRGTVEHIFS